MNTDIALFLNIISVVINIIAIIIAVIFSVIQVHLAKQQIIEQRRVAGETSTTVNFPGSLLIKAILGFLFAIFFIIFFFWPQPFLRLLFVNPDDFDKLGTTSFRIIMIMMVIIVIATAWIVVKWKNKSIVSWKKGKKRLILSIYILVLLGTGVYYVVQAKPSFPPSRKATVYLSNKTVGQPVLFAIIGSRTRAIDGELIVCSDSSDKEYKAQLEIDFKPPITKTIKKLWQVKAPKDTLVINFRSNTTINIEEIKRLHNTTIQCSFSLSHTRSNFIKRNASKLSLLVCEIFASHHDHIDPTLDAIKTQLRSPNDGNGIDGVKRMSEHVTSENFDDELYQILLGILQEERHDSVYIALVMRIFDSVGKIRGERGHKLLENVSYKFKNDSKLGNSWESAYNSARPR